MKWQWPRIYSFLDGIFSFTPGGNNGDILVNIPNVFDKIRGFFGSGHIKNINPSRNSAFDIIAARDHSNGQWYVYLLLKPEDQAIGSWLVEHPPKAP